MNAIAQAPEVIVIGYGPVGKVLAILLAQRGRQVLVLERFADSYPLPRAVHFDDETARILALAGIGDRFDEIGEPGDQYDWQNGRGETLLHFDYSAPGRSAWPQATLFNQPTLEAILNERAAQLHNLTVLRGHTVLSAVDIGSDVEIRTDGPDGPATFVAPYVVGCDGANSTIRRQMGVAVHDEGFFYDWLICDVIPHGAREFTPNNLQICDPRRPTTQVSSGKGRRRWEFMRMPGETVEYLNDRATAWALLAPFAVDPTNATLERAVVYTFQARWSDQWRIGRMLIAGDAAHLMPPFAGQGMCSGLRDAVNLAWKLDLVLGGVADQALLDTYGQERSGHVQHAMGMSIELGRVICLLDEAAAAQRDASMLAHGGDPARALPPLPLPLLTSGLLSEGGGGLMPQGRVRAHGRTGRFDDILGTGGFLLCRQVDVDQVNEARRAFLESAGVRVVAIDGVDIDRFYGDLLTELNATALLVRPDYWVFGTAGRREQIPELIDNFQAGLRAQVASNTTAGQL